MKHGLLTLTAAAAGVAFASTAAAQVTAERMQQGSQKRTIDIQAQARVEHDTNIARTDQALAAARDIEPEDTLYAPTLNVDIVNPVGRQAIFLRGSAGYLFHDKNERLDHSRFDLTGGLGASLGPCGAVAQAGYSRGRSELDQLTLVGTVENILEIKRAGFSLSCTRPPGISVFGSVAKDWGENSEALSIRQDYETLVTEGGLSFSRPRAGAIGLIGTYERTEYPNRLSASEVEGYELTGAGVRLERRIGGRIEASARASYSHVELLAPLPGIDETQFDGWTYGAEVSYRVSSRLRLNALLDRQISPTLIGGQALEVQTNYRVRADYRVGSRFIVGAQASQDKSDSRGGTTTPVAGVLTASRTRAYLGSLTYRQSEHLSFVITARREKRTADNPQFNYNSERYGISADYSF